MKNYRPDDKSCVDQQNAMTYPASATCRWFVGSFVTFHCTAAVGSGQGRAERYFRLD